MRKFFLLLMLIALVGCKTTKDVQTNIETHTDTMYISQLQRDSIWFHDSIYLREYMQGDTLVLYKYVQQVKYKDVYKHDTIYQSKCDTVYKEREKIVEKGGGLKTFNRTLVSLSLLILVACGAYITYKIVG